MRNAKKLKPEDWDSVRTIQAIWIQEESWNYKMPGQNYACCGSEGLHRWTLTGRTEYTMRRTRLGPFTWQGRGQDNDTRRQEQTVGGHTTRTGSTRGNGPVETILQFSPETRTWHMSAKPLRWKVTEKRTYCKLGTSVTKNNGCWTDLSCYPPSTHPAGFHIKGRTRTVDRSGGCGPKIHEVRWDIVGEAVPCRLVIKSFHLADDSDASEDLRFISARTPMCRGRTVTLRGHLALQGSEGDAITATSLEVFQGRTVLDATAFTLAPTASRSLLRALRKAGDLNIGTRKTPQALFQTDLDRLSLLCARTVPNASRIGLRLRIRTRGGPEATRDVTPIFLLLCLEHARRSLEVAALDSGTATINDPPSAPAMS